MVLMGGGPEAPQRGDDQKRELLLCVQPSPVGGAKHVVEEIKEEFPNLDVQFFGHPEFAIKEGDLSIPEGKCNPFRQLRATASAHLWYLHQHPY
jgi:hypothetical protein